MRSTFVLSATVLATAFVVAAPAKALCCKEIAYSNSPIQQAALADVVVVGKVCDIEPELSMIEQYPGSGNVAHMVGTIRVSESLLGAKGLTHVRVGYVPTNRQVQVDELGFGLKRLGGEGRFWRGHANLTQGQEACFFLQKHPTADFFVLAQMGYPLEKSDLNYESELSAVRKMLRAVEQPIEALKAKETGDRQLAACALIHRYRQQRNTGGQVTSEAVSAEESKLILQNLAEMKWGELPFDPNGTFSLQNIFWQLQLTEKDGWKQPQQKDNEDYNTLMSTAVSTWLKDNSDKYRVQRLVAQAQAIK